ncbi:MAG: dihydroxy-acid dehydratase [Hyphomicrobiaceae bacterium]
MDARVFDTPKWSGRHRAEGLTRAPRRSNLENVKFSENQKVVLSVSKAISASGGVADVMRSLAREGAIVKVAGMKTLQFGGPARVSDCLKVVENRDDKTGEIFDRRRATLLAATRTLLAKRVLGSLGALALLLTLAFSWAAPAVAGSVTFASPSAALEQGIGAYKAGHYQLAEPALKVAADTGEFFGQYYLAQLYSDNNSAYTDHGKAYKLFVGIVDENANADPDDDQRASYVGKALTAVAGYTRRGLPEIGLVPNAERAAKFFRDAATFFRDSDAQFELAKMHLKGEGVAQDQRLAFHWLSTLTQEGHAGAQAFLADLLWRGKDMPKDEKRALALIKVAVANAPERDRIWIEDIYQNIFCGASSGIRQDADGLVAVWKRLYSPRAGADQGDHLGLGIAARTCGSGEALPLPDVSREGRKTNGSVDQQRTPAAAVPDTKALHGGAASGIREIGAGRR